MTRYNLIAAPVAGIEPVNGWTLFSYEEPDGDRFWADAYFARGPVRDVMLDVSRFGFTPSQERFAWLVRRGFPKRRGIGPWDDTEIEHMIGQEEAFADQCNTASAIHSIAKAGASRAAMAEAVQRMSASIV